MDWMESQFKTCTHGCDWKAIAPEAQDNIQVITCSDSGYGRKNPRKVLLRSIQIGFNGSFRGSNRNVRGFIYVSVRQDDGQMRPIMVVPFGGYGYHNDYYYFEGQSSTNCEIVSDYIPAGQDWSRDMEISISNSNNCNQECDIKCYVVCNLRIKE
ncbi:putative nuclear shuttle protein [abaca bunchy top virus]|uniref:Putative nuclear shuttle protein n=1 Tax=abaca bunchy top virus TaxID=3158377 RepID=B0LBX4_9VIRU|nr:putative nuclear shuttle protein [Abaca bunchy top virus]ABP96961.1 putative nuclear shuttle protein [Abaca bunchy top virus]